MNEKQNDDIILDLKDYNMIMHPITGGFIEKYDENVKNITIYNYNKKSQEFLSYNIIEKNKNKSKSKKSKKKNEEIYYDYLYIPPATFTYENLLDIYYITDIDTLYDFILNSNENFRIQNRLLNSWIYKNLNIVKHHNNKIIKIYNIFFKYFNYGEKIISKFKTYFDNIISSKYIYNIDIYYNFIYKYNI